MRNNQWMRVLVVPEAYRRIVELGREGRLDWIAASARTIDNPLHLGAVLKPLGNGFWKDRIGTDRIIATSERNPKSGDWELIITDVHRRSSGETVAGAYRRLLDDLDGTRDSRREEIRTHWSDLRVLPAAAATSATPAKAGTPVLRNTDPLAGWLQLTWASPAARTVLLGRDSWDRGLPTEDPDRQPAADLIRAALGMSTKPGMLDTVEVGGNFLTYLDVPGSLFRSERCILLIDTEHEHPGILGDGLREEIERLQHVCADIEHGRHDPFAVPGVLRGLADWIYSIDHRHPVEDHATKRVQFDPSLLIRLTAEQVELLDRVLLQRPPTFITGRAGSSKSTIAHHAFARYCIASASLHLPGEPRFVTRGERLRAEAFRRVRAILQTEHHFSGSADDLEFIEQVEGRMTTIADHLRSALPPEQQSDFGDSNYIDFARFRQLYLGRSVTGAAAPKHLTFSDHTTRDSTEPSLAWFVLRSIVKGFDASRDWTDPNECFSMDDYDELPDGDRHVDADEAARVIESVLPWYRRLHVEEGLWDDQDLAIAVYRSAGAASSSGVAALVCDEAQDFTRVELLALLRTLSFFEYDLARLPGRTLPIVLAGDELQTVHPTGFRWANVTSGFYELIGAAFGRQDTLTIGEELLHSNFRSSPEVVDLANAVQAVRRARLREESATPQKALREPTSVPCRFFALEKLESKQLEAVLATNVVIVPCDEGGERSYVERDPVLHKVFGSIASDWMAGEPATAAPVYGPHEAKGLEFPSVVLYGWGDHVTTPSNIDVKRTAIGERARYTDLYVAVTRAAERVVAIDHIDRCGLWHELVDLLESEHQSTESLRAGTADDFSSVVGDATQLAREMAERGNRLESAEELLRAADRFQALEDEREANRLRAEALRVDGRLSEAAELFEELGDQESAEECLWLDGAFERLARRPTRTDTPRSELGRSRYSVARAITSTSPSPDVWIEFAEALARLKSSARGRKAVGVWQSALASYLEGIDAGLLDGQTWSDVVLGHMSELAQGLAPNSAVRSLPVVQTALYLDDLDSTFPASTLDAISHRYPDPVARRGLLRWFIGEVMNLDSDVGLAMLGHVARSSPSDADAVELDLLIQTEPDSPRVAEVVARRVGHLADSLESLLSLIGGNEEHDR